MKWRYHILALIVVAIWGVTFVCTKTLIAAGLEPARIFFCRFVVAYAGMWALTLLQKGKINLFSESVRDEIIFLVLGITGGSFYFLTENTALKYSQACNVSFIVCLAPLLTLLLHYVIVHVGGGRFSKGQEDVRMNAGLLGGTVLALVGMSLVIFSETKMHISPKGDLLAFCAALCWAVYSVVMGMVSDRYGSLFITRKVFFYGLLTIIPFVLDGPMLPAGALRQPEVLFNLLFLSLVASLACFVAWNKVMARIGNVSSTHYVYLNPFFTLVSAMVFLGERLTPIEAVGSVAIVLGVILAGSRNATSLRK
ncbi:MAG: DMT family transporter [Bacteroidales bacterium]|nr:DMT family transporter [Bacteroidales bacterium]